MYENMLLKLGQPGIPRWTGGEIRAVARSDVGMVRESNQDSFHICHDTGLYIVADGMGGRAGGEIASNLAVTTVGLELERNLEALLSRNIPGRRTLLSQAVNAASLKIYERSLELPQFRGMGTTTTFLWIPPFGKSPSRTQDHAIVAHVGDSRCYLLRAGLLYQVTEDHSLVNEKIKSGMLKRGDPIIAQTRNIITRCVGYQEEEEVDTFVLPLFVGDRFLLCSDGLTSKLDDVEIAQNLAGDDLDSIPNKLISLANSRGGEDNVTVMVVAVQ